MDNNYTLGRGELHFNKFLPGTKSGIGERYLGNTPEFGSTSAVENLDHFNSDHGIKEKDASIVLSNTRSASFSTDNISLENLGLWYFGDSGQLTQTAATAETDIFPAVRTGLFYQLGSDAVTPEGSRNVTNLVVKNTATPTTIYTLGTDYMLNPNLGRVEILAGGPLDTAIKASPGQTGVGITCTYNTLLATYGRVISGGTAIEGTLRFIADNPAGKNYDYFYPYVKLSPNGDMALKGDTWQVIPFNVEVLKRTGYQSVYVTERPAAV